MKLAFGLVLAVCLGIFCRFFDIPLPGPPAIMGAVMAIAMASGYTVTDHLLSRGKANTPVEETAIQNPPVSADDSPVPAESPASAEAKKKTTVGSTQ